MPDHDRAEVAKIKGESLGQILPGLSLWNLYFIAKLILHYQGFIEFHLLENLAFLAFLLFPVQSLLLKISRQIAAIPVGLWLLHYDSFLPPLSRLTAQLEELSTFELDYLVELFFRFFPPRVLLVGFLLLVVYYFFSKVFKLTAVVVLAVAVFSVQQVQQQLHTDSVNKQASSGVSQVGIRAITDELLNTELGAFFEEQAKEEVPISVKQSANADFDILFLSVCSLGWDDLEVSGYSNPALFSRFDIVFDQFNSVTSYSGPALLRLSKSRCGQLPHKGLYEALPPECNLFASLETPDFEQSLLLNHSGKFGNFLERLRSYGGINATLMPQDNLTVTQKDFSGDSIYKDYDVLSKWWSYRLEKPNSNFVALYNTTTLHDGNRLLQGPRIGLPSYKLRIDALLKDFNRFLDDLEKSGRNVLVVLIPEHGAGLRGDKMQISGMREIPSRSITHVPVMAKLIGPGLKRQGDVAHVDIPTSHMSITRLLENIFEQNTFAKAEYSAADLIRKMPELKWVSQNEAITVMQENKQFYISLDGQTWSNYPD
ncbi:cellulose biosynthesis protein BcsG [Spongiibacter sp. KMU-158]|uniref:Cellulose biosynthesis protein BcsG n=1 Tax=Spongiibacter pelagi TaxID=2760804 RepID=A0A927BY39_9GAMM|nr:cellulose biosynthesis protein BcsG [Spongiibacter pelagi]MBD2857685.1 cellulose biosynthesis protein BcsG [Spongiibacter pelagi]